MSESSEEEESDTRIKHGRREGGMERGQVAEHEREQNGKKKK